MVRIYSYTNTAMPEGMTEDSADIWRTVPYCVNTDTILNPTNATV